MFDVSWGEIAVLTAVGLTLLGKKDLPPASRALGQQVGRIVGLLRGARMRADRYATDHRLKKLQDEFKSGLRELDAVKAELAGSMTIGYGDRLGSLGTATSSSSSSSSSSGGVDHRRRGMGMGMRAMVGGEETNGAVGAGYRPPSTSGGGGIISAPAFVPSSLAPRSRTVAAVAEEEWERRGIGFRSIAEGGGTGGGGGGIGITTTMSSEGGAVAVGGGGGGAVILSNHLRQSLIYDQYERTVREQDEALRSRVEKVRNERIADGKEGGGNKTVE